MLSKARHKPLAGIHHGVTIVYCIKTAKDITRLVARPDASVVLVFEPIHRYAIISRASSLSRTTKYMGRKISNFWPVSLVLETIQDKPMVTVDH